MINPIAIAIPVFFLAIGVEVWVARRRNLRAHRLADALSNLGCGVGNQVMAIAYGALLLALYATVYEHAALVRFAEGSPWPWVIAFVGVDFLYYWWHRFSHEVNFLWAAHVVHHQSEDYNLAVALRQAYFTSITIQPFYLVLAIAGVPPLAYAISAAFSLLYQFWIHTEVIDRLPRSFEWLFNTPSHHRVHHAINRQYLDRNYGATLIVWDRLFGTFEPEREPCVYGITKPLRSFNPVWANFAYWGELFRVARAAPNLPRALRVFVARPGWNPASNQVELPAQVERGSYVKFDVEAPTRGMIVWLATQFTLVALAVVALLVFAQRMPLPVVLAAGALIVTATMTWSGLIERRPWARPLEAVRVVGSIAVLAWAVVGGLTQVR